MNEQEKINYQRVAEAIDYIRQNFKTQPSLEELAEQVHLSPFHFQRLFTEWAGTSPKKFLQYISVEYAKSLLKEKQATLFDAAFETGLSGTGRLHDLFVQIEGMTPGEFKNGGESLRIQYDYAETPFGPILVAATEKGVCYMAFADDPEVPMAEMRHLFPKANYVQQSDMHQRNALQIFERDWQHLEQIKLHLKGTAFQIKVWETLLKIPVGQLSTYGNIAAQIEHPKASRAVGSAVGNNPVAFLIPCHRVIQSTGHFGQYHWGSTRKVAMIGWEAAVGA
jgi:AraC family transcriptional regulator of adaptative response/methylated-DNA-[protein]-cysteine methyltransferase